MFPAKLFGGTVGSCERAIALNLSGGEAGSRRDTYQMGAAPWDMSCA